MKGLTTFALVIALMTGSVAELAVLLYRGARMIAVSSLSLAAAIGSREWREQDRLQEEKERIIEAKRHSISRKDKTGRTNLASSCWPVKSARPCWHPPFQQSALSGWIGIPDTVFFGNRVEILAVRAHIGVLTLMTLAPGVWYL